MIKVFNLNKENFILVWMQYLAVMEYLDFSK